MSERRKPGPKPGQCKPKKHINIRVRQECIDVIRDLSDASGLSMPNVVEWAFLCKIKGLPDNALDTLKKVERE